MHPKVPGSTFDSAAEPPSAQNLAVEASGLDGWGDMVYRQDVGTGLGYGARHVLVLLG